jgi:hypothetical protein
MTVAVSPAWSERLVSEFNDSDARVKTLTKGLSVTQLNWPPRPDAWSIGQCLEHLAISSDVYLAAIASALINRQPGGSVDQIVLGPFGGYFIRNFIEPTPTTKRARAPRKITPTRSSLDSGIVDRFLAGNEKARALVRRAAGYDVNHVRFRNPFIPLLRFSVGTGLELHSSHERRHLLQAERVKTAPGFPDR